MWLGAEALGELIGRRFSAFSFPGSEWLHDRFSVVPGQRSAEPLAWKSRQRQQRDFASWRTMANQDRHRSAFAVADP